MMLFAVCSRTPVVACAARLPGSMEGHAPVSRGTILIVAERADAPIIGFR